MTSGAARRIAWLAMMALLVNMAAQVGAGAALAAVGSTEAAEGPGGPVIVICTPEGMKRLVWSDGGYVPLPEPAGAKPPCPLCGSLSAGALLPEPPRLPVPVARAQRPAVSPVAQDPACHAGCAPPPVRAPPRAA